MTHRLLSAVLVLCLGTTARTEDDLKYDPLRVAVPDSGMPMDRVVKDAERDREIPVRISLPVESTPAPVVLFSHGLGGSRKGNPYLGRHWSARGYAVVYLQHAGSDESVWKDAPPLQRFAAMQAAANLQNTIDRLRDVRVVIDQLERWNAEEDSTLRGRFDLARLGMSGHSFGAVTTQWVSGQQLPRGGARFTDSRIKAAFAMSPSGPRRGDADVSFGRVSIPWLLMTGTKDESPIGNADVASRLSVFPALPPGGKYELVLHDGAHEAFSDRDLPGTKVPRNPNHHRVILAISTAFWDAWLREDPAARKWLDGEGPASLLDPKDRWQRK